MDTSNLKLSLILILTLTLSGCTKVTKVTIGNVNYIVEIADTDAKRTKGLMYRKEMSENEGMLFIFKDIGPKSFWMKNTYIPLDMIFINEEKEIVTIFRNTIPCIDSTNPCDSYKSGGNIKYVLEINAHQTEKNNIESGIKVIIPRI